MGTRTEIGRAGEDAAADHYRRAGYRTLDRNWRCAIGELDLVLERERTLVICEVKARRGGRLGAGWEAVDARKQAKLRALAEVYLQRRRAGPSDVRFDVASVRIASGGRAHVEVFEDAF